MRPHSLAFPLVSRLINTATLVIVFSSEVGAQQCVNPKVPDCKFYSACMEKTCKCGFGATGYALSYGRKYCERFLSRTDFSPSGVAWRDATLRCLQERLVAELPSDSKNCDCNRLRDVAYSTHVACYTQSERSVCDLSESDISKIGDLVDASDAFDSEGLKAILQIASQCLISNPRNAWHVIQKYVASRQK